MGTSKILLELLKNKIYNQKPNFDIKMQEVCTTIDSPVVLGQPLIKSETPNVTQTTNPIQCPPNLQVVTQQQQQNGGKLGPEKQNADSSYWMPTESGFINSQPSMAEFLTHMEPESPKANIGGYPVTSIDSCDSVPEYPWMKEKKTSRKNNVQGIVTLYILHYYY